MSGDKSRKETEHDLRLRVAVLFHNNGYTVTSVNGLACKRGGYLVRSYIVHGYNLSEGWPDLQCVKDGSILFIETKGPKTRISESQINIAKILKNSGTPVYVVRDYAEAFAVLAGENISSLELLNQTGVK